MRWQIFDPVTSETYVLPKNPTAMTSLGAQHKTTSFVTSPIDGRTRAFRVPDQPHAWTFTGRLRDKDTYDQLLAWCHRANRVQVTDHYGRVHDVLLTKFTPLPMEKSGVGNAWLFSYQVDALYYGRIA